MPTCRAGFGPYLLSWKIKVEESAQLIYVANFCRVSKTPANSERVEPFSVHIDDFHRFFFRFFLTQKCLGSESKPPGVKLLGWCGVLVEAASSDGGSSHFFADDVVILGEFRMFRKWSFIPYKLGSDLNLPNPQGEFDATGSERITRGLGWPRDWACKSQAWRVIGTEWNYFMVFQALNWGGSTRDLFTVDSCMRVTVLQALKVLE